MIIEYRNFIKRQDLREEPNAIFLFGDNIVKHGLGGQAREMRGEPNAIGIPTKFLPETTKDSYFTDEEYFYNVRKIDEAFAFIPLTAEKVVIPKAGLETGLAELDKKAPKTFEYLQKKIKDLENA